MNLRYISLTKNMELVSVQFRGRSFNAVNGRGTFLAHWSRAMEKFAASNKVAFDNANRSHLCLFLFLMALICISGINEYSLDNTNTKTTIYIAIQFDK